MNYQVEVELVIRVVHWVDEKYTHRSIMTVGSGRNRLGSRERDCTHRSESARDGDSGHGAAGLPQSVPEHCVYMEFRKELGVWSFLSREMD